MVKRCGSGASTTTCGRSERARALAAGFNTYYTMARFSIYGRRRTWRARWIILLVIIAMIGVATADATQPVTVRTSAGAVLGTRDTDTGTDSFRGIRYGAPPVGAQRFLPSVAATGGAP